MGLSACMVAERAAHTSIVQAVRERDDKGVCIHVFVFKRENDE